MVEKFAISRGLEWTDGGGIYFGPTNDHNQETQDEMPSVVNNAGGQAGEKKGNY
jgi:hypothetical protein